MTDGRVVGVDDHRAAHQLRLVSETLEVAASLGAPIWLRGGWAMDFFLGQVTRDHTDIDWFAWAVHAPALGRELLRHGYQPAPGPPPEQQLDVVKEGLDSSFAWLARDRKGRVVVAGGPWAGELWPEGMLDGTEGRIRSLRSPIVSPLAQIEIKRMMPVWVPGLARRPKDAADVTRLEAALRARSAQPEPGNDDE